MVSRPLAGGTCPASNPAPTFPSRRTPAPAYRSIIARTDSSPATAAGGTCHVGTSRSLVSSRGPGGRTGGPSVGGATSIISGRPSGTVSGFTRTPGKQSRGRSAARRTISADSFTGAPRSTAGACIGHGPRAGPSKAGTGTGASRPCGSGRSRAGTVGHRSSRGRATA